MSDQSINPAKPGNRAIRLIDAFSGCGGMTLGFVGLSKGRFTPVWANDINQYAADSYNANFGHHCHVGNIVDLLDEPTIKVPPAEIVIGGPPCQGFSLLNKDRVGDPRKELWRPFLEIVQRSGSSCFVMENVPQLLSSPEFTAIVAKAQGMGFKVASAKLCAADYGVPQTRRRAFVVGCRFADPAPCFPPRKSHCNPNKGVDSLTRCEEYTEDAGPWTNTRDAIADLPKPVGTEIRSEPGLLDLHFGRNPTAKSMARYRAIPEEGMNRFDLHERAPELTPQCWIKKKTGGTDLFGRLWWDRPAFTIRTEFFKPEKGRYLHPEQHRP